MSRSRSLSSITLYGNTYKMRLSKSIEEEFKILCVREVLQYCKSSYHKVSGERVAVKTSRKLRAEVAIAGAESQLHHGVLIGAVSQGNAGLGIFATLRYEKAQHSSN